MNGQRAPLPRRDATDGSSGRAVGAAVVGEAARTDEGAGIDAVAGTAGAGADGGARTVVVGFDGLAFRYLDAFDLPNFEALRARGVEAPLRSTHPPWTASAWPSMYTGTGPGHHGVFSFFDFEGTSPADADVVTRNDVRAPALWDYLSSRGAPSIALNLPVTHPAAPIEGVLIPGYLAPEETPGYPEGIRESVSAAIGEPYRIYADAELADDPAAKLDGYVDLIDLRRRAAAHLLADREWELAIVQVQKTDAVFHNFDDPDAWERVYAAADEFLGTVLDAVDDDVNVVVCSDHGMRSRDGYVIHVNEVLRDHGLVRATTDGQGPSLLARKRGWVEGATATDVTAGTNGADGTDVTGDGASVAETDEGAAGRIVEADDERVAATDDGTAGGAGEAGGHEPPLAARVVSTIVRASRAAGVEPGVVYGTLERVGLGRPLLRLLPEGASMGQAVDWQSSRAYCRLGTEMGVRINLEGREPDGVVAPADYDAVRGRIIDVLSGLETPDGEPAFAFVEPREAVYDGPHVERAPDVVFRPAGMNHGVVASLVGRRFIPTDAYNHDVDGVFVGAGPGFEPDASPDRLALPDVAPLVMALLGRAVPARMTGAVPAGLLSGPVERRDYGDVSFGTAPAERSDGDRVEARLEDLGYL